MNKTARSTDWDRYYRRPFAATSITRKISERKIISLLQRFCGADNPKILELGGANSCFAGAISEQCNPSAYSVADNNKFGLSLFSQNFGARKNFSATEVDALDRNSVVEIGQHDIVFSVGLIEHFDPENTAKCIESHFAACKNGGVVLITFPTPTKLYRGIRGVAEITGKWAFPDERPLLFEEVTATGARFGEPLHQSINWYIGLTQGYVVYQKK